MRKNAFPITAGVLGSLALAVSASGQFINVTIEDYAAAGQPAGSVTYRVVAHWASDAVFLAWGAIPGDGELIFFTGNGVNLMNDDGSPFFGSKQEDFAQFPIASDWDSWLTVGKTGFAGNNTDYSTDFIGSDGKNAAVVGNAFSETDGLVFNSNPGNQVIGTDLVLAQFTIPGGKGNPHNGFHLEGIVAWNPVGAGPGFNVSPFSVDNIPAPGALALLGLAGLAGARRRRRG